VTAGSGGARLCYEEARDVATKAARDAGRGALARSPEPERGPTPLTPTNSKMAERKCAPSGARAAHRDKCADELLVAGGGLHTARP
jgi:hypothetical protein